MCLNVLINVVLHSMIGSKKPFKQTKSLHFVPALSVFDSSLQHEVVVETAA